MFSRNRKAPAPFDRAGKEPVIRASICTGEKVAGFRDLSTGKFVDVMLIRTDKDLQRFLDTYGFDANEVKHEW